LSLRPVEVLSLMAMMCRMIVLGMITVLGIEAILPHFDLLATGDGLIQDVNELVLRAPLQPVQQLLSSFGSPRQ
jgi:hypothetical protein